jgi:hypothetical protein
MQLFKEAKLDLSFWCNNIRLDMLESIVLNFLKSHGLIEEWMNTSTAVKAKKKKKKTAMEK